MLTADSPKMGNRPLSKPRMNTSMQIGDNQELQNANKEQGERHLEDNEGKNAWFSPMDHR